MNILNDINNYDEMRITIYESCHSGNITEAERDALLQEVYAKEMEDELFSESVMLSSAAILKTAGIIAGSIAVATGIGAGIAKIAARIKLNKKIKESKELSKINSEIKDLIKKLKKLKNDYNTLYQGVSYDKDRVYAYKDTNFREKRKSLVKEMREYEKKRKETTEELKKLKKLKSRFLTLAKKTMDLDEYELIKADLEKAEKFHEDNPIDQDALDDAKQSAHDHAVEVQRDAAAKLREEQERRSRDEYRRAAIKSMKVANQHRQMQMNTMKH